MGSMTLVLMFLVADLLLPEALPAWPSDLEEEQSISWTTTTSSAFMDAGIDSGNSMTNYGSAVSVELGPTQMGEARMLLAFNNTFNSSYVISNAFLQVTCGVNQSNIDTIHIFSSRMKKTWNEGTVTWNGPTQSANWGQPGADSSADHGSWEPPFDGQNNNTFDINVTAIVQDAVANNRSTVNLLLAATGTGYTCYTSDAMTTSNRPSLMVTYTMGTPGSGGTLTPNFVEDGAALMANDGLVIRAATTPDLSWSALSGDDVQIQLSLGEEFISDLDAGWYWNTEDNSSLFTTNGTSGSMGMTTNALTNSSTMYYRMRAIDSTRQIGDWVTGYFHLPGHSVTDNSDGTATFSFTFDDLGLSEETIEDTYVDSSNGQAKNVNHGNDKAINVGASSTTQQQYMLMRINLDDLGMHSNSTIVDATLSLNRNTSSGSALVSAHVMDTDAWDEDAVTWKKSTSSTWWDDGGRTQSMSVANMMGNQSSSTFDFDLTAALQRYIDQNSGVPPSSANDDSIDLMFVASTYGRAVSGTSSVVFDSTETLNGTEPVMEITYRYGTGQAPSSPSLSSPVDGIGVWNITGHNLSGNTTPDLVWSTTGVSGNEMILEISRDADFRDIAKIVDTSVDTDFTPSDGIWSLVGANSLDLGVGYHWRISHRDSNDHQGWWSEDSFVVSALESVHLGNDRYELRLRHGNATTAGDVPYCGDTYIDSGTTSSNYNGEDVMQISYNTWPSETSVLIGCDLVSHLLPSGYAVESAELSMRLDDYPTGTPVVAAWESRQHNWTETGASWSTYDGVNSWGTSGAKGWERASMLDSSSLGSSYSPGDRMELDVTLAVQNAMRDGRGVDLIVGLVGVGSGNNRDVLLNPNSDPTAANRPQLSFVYVPGSNAIPANPVPYMPLNGSWAVEQGIEPSPITQPTLEWNFTTGNVTVGGWSIELDTADTFDTGNLLTAASWNNAGFDIANMTYDVSNSQLLVGNTWYWRVRATSTTNQIGNWSNVFHFQLPDITTWSIDADSAAVEIRHRDALPHLNIPNFIDTWVVDGGADFNQTHSSSTSLKVGTDSNGNNATSLIMIPLTELPNPQNAHISEATLNMYAEFGSSSSNHVSVHPVLVDWNSNANGSHYDGTLEWDEGAGLGVNDSGGFSDVSDGANANWMTLDITELVQAAYAAGESHLSIMLQGTQGQGQTIFTSVNGTASQHPWMNLTWTNGSASTAPTAGNNVLPSNNQIVWDTSTHALLPDQDTTFEWYHANSGSVDDWRLFIYDDHSNVRSGWTMYDSRELATGWGEDSTGNYSLVPPTSLTVGSSFRWFVQPISDDILGAMGSSSIFHIPAATGATINSTDANLSLQEGQLVEALAYPSIFLDTNIDSGSSMTSYERNSRLIAGRSNVTSSSAHHSFALIQINWSSLPIPDSHEFVNATLTLTRLNGGEATQETITLVVGELATAWNESATYASPTGSNNSSWGSTSPPAIDMVNVTYEDTTIDIDVSYAVQHAHASGSDTISLIIAIPDTQDEWHFASSNYNVDESLRPELSLSWRTGEQWLPPAATDVLPLDGSTIWNQTSSRPRGADNVTGTWNSTINNETRWVAQVSMDPNFADLDNTWLYDFSDSSTYNGTFSSSTINGSEVMSYVTPDNIVWGDYWLYWRVRAEQDHRLGAWTSTHSYRVPGAYGSDDGAGNHSITLYQSSIFEDTGELPGVPDSSIDSTLGNTALGASSAMNLGIAPSGSGESQMLISFDLGELPFPAAMTPTSALLSMYRQSVSGTSSLTVSAHACDSFSENSVTWNNSPSCLTSEITRSTLLVSPPNTWVEWDITSLAQSNVANGNNTLTVLLQSTGTPGSRHAFHSGEYWNKTYRPRLVLDYVDNVNGILPPAQPSLNYPSDGAVLYNTSSWVLSSEDQPQLSWNTVANATGYVVTISQASGQQKYKSWEDSEINGTTFSFANSLTAGSVYQWWVQAINGSIPGPSSSRSTFAIGDPQDNTDNGDHTWTYIFQTGNEVADLGHTNIRDSYIGDGNPDQNHGNSPMMAGTDCEGALTECRMIIALDNSQIPLPMAANIHSASVQLQVSDQQFNGAISLTFSVHRLLTGAWTQAGSTWNSSSSGINWATPGMTAGTDYDSTAISSTTVMAGSTEVWLEIGHDYMQMDGNHAWIIIATPDAGAAWMEFYSSEQQASVRPMITMNYTNVDSVTVSPSGSTTDADTSVQYSHLLEDALGSMISEDVTWSSSDDNIDSNGLYTPILAGQHTIKACFGVICSTDTITVTPGAPVTLVVSDTSEIITADESFTISAEIQDQHGNTVPGQSITYTPTNGSMSGATFMPYAIGPVTVTVGWSVQTIDVSLVVLGGVPTHYLTTGCEDVVKAGTTCTLSWTIHDQYGNLLDLAVGGGISWSTTEGVFTEENGTYFATLIGVHEISMLSTGGISHSLNITVDHGEMSYLELNASIEEITADDRVWFNTTRVDIMGNRLSVMVPSGNWTYFDGILEEGQPAIWHAESRGAKLIKAQYAGMEGEVTIQISEGEITGLILVVESVESTYSLFNLTADGDLTVKVKAHDSDGNRWTEDVNWRIEHASFNDQSILQEQVYGSSTYFVPIHASPTPYTLYATYDGGTSFLEVSLSIMVVHGDLVTIELIQPSSLSQDIDADMSLNFLPQLTDSDGNIIDSSIISYRLTNTASGNSTDITGTLLASSGNWPATEVGEWSITAWAINDEGYEISETVDIIVRHGEAISVDAKVPADTATSGDNYGIEVIGTDSDGNEFPQDVIWREDGKKSQVVNSTGVAGEYTWDATTKGEHILTYSVGSATNNWTVNVNPNSRVNVIILHILLPDDRVEQLESFEIWVQTYDAWGNEISVPPSTYIEATGRMTIIQLNASNWQITSLDEGKQTVTVQQGNVQEYGEIEVDGTFLGFFEAGGALYYAGAVLGLLMLIVLLVVIVMVFRSGSSGYDDEDEEYDDEDDDKDYYDVAPSIEPQGQGPSGPPPSEPTPEEDTSWIVEHRFDDDGTEWAEDENGTWWYRESGVADWAEWTE